MISEWLAYEAADFLLGPDDWQKAPTHVVEQAESLLEEGAPVGIAQHPTHGWLVLISWPTGPAVAWSENESS